MTSAFFHHLTDTTIGHDKTWTWLGIGLATSARVERAGADGTSDNLSSLTSPVTSRNESPHTPVGPADAETYALSPAKPSKRIPWDVIPDDGDEHPAPTEVRRPAAPARESE